MPMFAYEHQDQRRTPRCVDDVGKDLMKQLEWKAGDGCNKMGDA